MLCLSSIPVVGIGGLPDSALMRSTPVEPVLAPCPVPPSVPARVPQKRGAAAHGHVGVILP